jgi:hypothetical protein
MCFLQNANIWSANWMCPSLSAAEKRVSTPSECARPIRPNSIAYRHAPM